MTPSANDFHAFTSTTCSASGNSGCLCSPGTFFILLALLEAVFRLV